MNPQLSQASTLPSHCYTDPAVYEQERSRAFWNTWQVACHAASVREPGSTAACEIAGEQVVIVRGHDHVLRAFANVCRHRASLLVDSAPKCVKALRCPYHGWVYSLDGRLLAAPEFEGVENWNREDVCLPPYAVEQWGPYIFVNVDGAAPPLHDVMDTIPGQIAAIGCAVNQLHFSTRRDYEIQCNWKVYVDNYLEGYHLPAAHPSLFRELDYAQYRVDTFRYYSSQYAPIRPQRDSEPRRYGAGDTGKPALYFWIFPNLMLNVYPDNLSANIIVPLGHNRTLTIFEWFTYSGQPIAQETIDFSEEIQQEDIRICESVQKGLASSSYQSGRYSVKRENGVHHFHMLLGKALQGSLHD
ncbi:MAG: Rieske 2Fe-2S domain-containing protein [Acidobacteria bacterium]|nr:Rieske 2Fe-2S domain-containing protein [Acidobacteriota bacterium]